MKRAVLGLVGLVTLLVAHDAPARAVQAPFYAYGIRDVTCQMYLTGSTPIERIAYDSWVLGFISGAGWGRPLDRALTGSTDQAIKDGIAKYCTGHPTDALPAAAVAMANELSRDKTPPR